MLLHIPRVLTAEQVATCRQALEQAEWADGRATAGHLSVRVKDNAQVPEGHPTARQLGDMILAALERNPLFVSAALPFKVVPPLFNRYAGGQSYGGHIDGAIRSVPGTTHRIRTDLSATLFLTPPADYDGGELIIEDTFGAHSIKLPPGDLILYPSAGLHHVKPVTRGARISSFFWVQSMVREDSQRTALFDLDTSIQELGRTGADQAAVLRLTGVYHNLLRRWADV